MLSILLQCLEEIPASLLIGQYRVLHHRFKDLGTPHCVHTHTPFQEPCLHHCPQQSTDTAACSNHNRHRPSLPPLLPSPHSPDHPYFLSTSPTPSLLLPTSSSISPVSPLIPATLPPLARSLYFTEKNSRSATLTLQHPDGMWS